MISRRGLLQGLSAAALTRVVGTMGIPNKAGAVRCVNVVNFIREIEPRFSMDMMLPVRSQMEILLRHRLPATWLLQYDALVSGPFVPFLKERIAANHEVGFWFEMNEKHCKAAGVEWRGRPGYEWDHIPHVAFTIGYTPEERIKLADAAMRTFHEVWGRYPASVASWNLDALTMEYLVRKYGVEAFAVCRDQIATDGFTIWGAPIAGYYPSKTNCWSPASSARDQIGSPVFRMLGQDPVYYYDREFEVNGSRIAEPDTMEPVWTSGRSTLFVRRFLNMIAEAPTLRFAYAQMGQENTFPWDRQEEAYPMQMKELAELRERGLVHVETMGDSGRRFKKEFRTTPAQAQVQLADPFGNTDPGERSIWYQSRFYRANLHLRGDVPLLRDLTVYSDRFQQPFLKEATRLTEVEQRMPAVLDGYHWNGAAYFEREGERLRLAGAPVVRDDGDRLITELPTDRGVLAAICEERAMTVRFGVPIALSFEWDPAKAMLTSVEDHRAVYRQDGFEVAVGVSGGTASRTEKGWRIEGKEFRLSLAQAA